MGSWVSQLGTAVPILDWRQDGTYYDGSMSDDVMTAFNLQGWENVLWFSPVYVPNQFALTRMGLYVSDDSASGNQFIRLGLYKDENGFPGEKVAESAPANIHNGGGSVIVPISASLSKGLYWRAFICGAAVGGISAKVAGYQVDHLAAGIGFGTPDMRNSVLGLENDDYVFASLVSLPSVIPSIASGQTYIYSVLLTSQNGLPSISLSSL